LIKIILSATIIVSKGRFSNEAKERDNNMINQFDAQQNVSPNIGDYEYKTVITVSWYLTVYVKHNYYDLV